MAPLRVLDLFSCLGCHALGFAAAGPFETVAFVEASPWRRAHLARRFPGVPIFDDIRTTVADEGAADIIIGGPPCQRTSVAAAIHGKRSGESLWPWMFRLAKRVRPEWVVVEQPPGHAEWEADVSRDLVGAGFHTARLEFEARDLGAPYERRRVFILACPSLERLALAWSAGPSAIERVKRAADARGAWDARELGALRVDARAAGEMDRSRARTRRERIEALGDSNPPGMAEVIGRAILAAARRDEATRDEPAATPEAGTHRAYSDAGSTGARSNAAVADTPREAG